MSKQIQIRNDLYERLVKAKKIIDDRTEHAWQNMSEEERTASPHYNDPASFSSVLDWLFASSKEGRKTMSNMLTTEPKKLNEQKAYFCDRCGGMTPQTCIDAEFQVFKCNICGTSNVFENGN